jgi:uncharacterized membrane protein
MTILNFDSSRGPWSGRSRKIVLGIGGLIAAIAIGSTLASNININSGPVEFGQGVAQTAACDGSITVSPLSSFVNSVDTSTLGSFMFTGIQVSDVDSSVGKCQGKTLTFKAYGDTETAALATYVVYVGEDAFSSGNGSITDSGIGTSSSSFTLTFDPATISASDVYKITVESSDGFGGIPNGDQYLGNQLLYIGANNWNEDLWADMYHSGTFFGEDGMPQIVLMNYLETSDPLFDQRALPLTNERDIAVAIAIGGDGQYLWNQSGTYFVIGCNSTDGQLSARICPSMVDSPISGDISLDYSGILTIPNSDITYGSAISTVDTTFETYTVQVKNTFTLDRNSSFLKVTTRVTNTGSATLSNLRVWALNGDQMVGSDSGDISLKNINNSGISQIDYSSRDGFNANAVLASTQYGTAIMYSSTADAAVHDSNCCDLSDLVFKDPASIENDLVSADAAYGLYFRLDNLVAGASHEFTWFFGGTTGSASNLASEMRTASRPDVYRP